MYIYTVTSSTKFLLLVVSRDTSPLSHVNHSTNPTSSLTGAMDAISKSLHSFSEVLAKFAPQEVATGNIIDRQRLLCDVKSDPEHSLWQLQERYVITRDVTSCHVV